MILKNSWHILCQLYTAPFLISDLHQVRTPYTPFVFVYPGCTHLGALRPLQSTLPASSAFMPRQYYDDLISLRSLESASDLVPPIVYRHTRQSRDDRCYPYDSRHQHQRTQDEVPKVEKTLEELTKAGIARQGDLGWTLEYATAYCYKHLIGNRPCVVDTIDFARQAPLGRKAPFLLFDCLDRNLFQGMLNGMVYLKWRPLSDNAPGITSARDVKDPRICIELNTRPFTERGASLDELLDALVHQMIHAYFLVCCGKQGKSAEQDGRLLDALHFGILMYTIQDISKDCEQGDLLLPFYAHQRACRSRAACHEYQWDSYDRGVCRSIARPYIAIDPHSGTVGPPPNDGRSHCMHDNRRFRYADIHDWQLSSFASAIGQEMDKKDNTIYDLDISGDLKPVERLEGPPSSTYVELIWDGKSIMAPREKALGFDSLAKSGKKEGKYELYMPKCDFLTFKCVWDFIQHKKYSPQETDSDSRASGRSDEPKGPPIIVHGNGKDTDATDGVVVHLRVFKAADSMKFTELQKYAIERLYDMATTSNDPITALKEIYNGAESNSINADLHKWAREFLARTDESQHERHGVRDRRDPWAFSYYHRSPQQYRGTSNYEKLISIHGDRFQELYHSNPVLKDDSKLVVAELSYPGHLTDDNPSVPAPINSRMPRMPSSPSSAKRPYYMPDIAAAAAAVPPPRRYHNTPLARQRSFSDSNDPIDWLPNPSCLAHAGQSPCYSYPHPHPHPRPHDDHELPYRHLRHEAAIPSPLAYPVLSAADLEDPRRILPPSLSPLPFYDYFSRSSRRRRRVNADTGNCYTRSRGRWGDGYQIL